MRCDMAVEVTDVFARTACRFLQGNRSFATKFTAMAGRLDKGCFPQNFFARSMCEELKKINATGSISTDELPGYGVSEQELKALRRRMRASESDLIAIVAGEAEQSCRALEYLAVLMQKFSTLTFPEPTREVRYCTKDGFLSFGVPFPVASVHWHIPH